MNLPYKNRVIANYTLRGFGLGFQLKESAGGESRVYRASIRLLEGI